MRLSEHIAIILLCVFVIGTYILYLEKIKERQNKEYNFKCCIPGQKLCIDGTTKEKIQNINTIREEIDSGSYKSHRSVNSKKYSSNIDNLVDELLCNNYHKKKLIKRLPWKKILSAIVLLFVISAAIQFILPPIYGDFGSDISIVLDPDGVHVNETLFVNITIPSKYNITQVNADMAGVETINMTLIDNSTLSHLWYGIWLVHDVVPDEYIMTIYAKDNENTSYQAGARLSILPDEIPVDNESDQNETIPPDIVDGNDTSNKTIIPSGLNLKLNSNKNSYEYYTKPW